MSTLSGNASKGEKTKPKFQSLDINNLYKISRGENTEKPAQKSSSSYIKHGMQSLGKVPNARRAPANLPSLKSEHSDSGAAVPLVPPGATGWGKQQEQGGSQSQNAQQNGALPTQGAPSAAQGPPQLTPHQQAIAIPSTNVIPPHNKQTTGPALSAGSSGGDKLWSAVMAGGQPDGGHPPAYQSPQFQHEFPSLSSGDGAGGTGPRPPTDYSTAGSVNQSGLSLRPQTEGSWTQGGQRASDGSVRSGSAPLGAPPQLAGPGGRPAEMLPPQMRGVLPPFMYKGSFPSGGSPAVPVGHPHPQMPSVGSHNGRRAADGRPPRLQDRDLPQEEVAPRPIIREEELSKLDDFGHDMGWAGSDDIDYNQKLAFSDDEDRPSKKEYKQSMHMQQQQQQQQQPQLLPQPHQSTQSQPKTQDVRCERQTPPKHWNPPRSDNYRNRQSDDDDVLAQKHRQHQKEVDLAIQRAKQRKEEEEKRFNEESRQRAQKKLQELNEKVREKRDRDRESEIGTISPSAVPPKPITHVEIPLPDFQKDKEKDQRTRVVSNESPPKEETSGFRQMTQIEGKSFSRKPQQKPERDHREQNGPSFSRHFQSDLPPRFLKHQQRNNGPQNSLQPNYYEPNRWSGNPPRAPSRGGRQESPERHEEERREYKRQSSDESYRSSHHSQSESNYKPMESHYNEEPYLENKWHKDKVESRYERKSEVHERHYDDRRSQEKVSDRFERPQRPDSRESHTSHTSHTSHGSQGSNRRSRDSDLKESMGSWNEDVEAAYEEKKEKERLKEEKRMVPALVPGPITRDRIEADDLNEKRNLTQLKKGEIPLAKKQELPKKEDKTRSNEKVAWSEPSAPVEDLESKKEPDTKPVEIKKPMQTQIHEDRQNRNNRSFSQSKSWGSSSSSSDFHSNRGPSWANKRPSSRAHKPGGREFYGTDSDGSTDTYSVDAKESKVVPRSKEDKNFENKQEKFMNEQKRSSQEKLDKKDGGSYVPRGEPSRHGRGGGNNFRGSRMGGMAKRIDGYGPPPSKSPFGHHDDRDKKISSDDTAPETSPAPASTPLTATDKIKQNQEALAAGIIGKSRQEPPEDKNKQKPKPENRRNKSKSRKEDQDKEASGELSDNKRQPVSRSSSQRTVHERRPGGNDRRDRNNPPRLGSERDKRSGFEINQSKKSDSKPDAQNLLASAIADISLKNRDEDVNDQKESGIDINGDSEGFQEVKSKKTTKDRPKGPEEKKVTPLRNEIKDIKQEKKLVVPSKPTGARQMTPQQIQNIPPLMSTPVNPPQMMPVSKNQYDSRSALRQNKLAPRFAKQKMEKQMQQHMMNDVGDMSKVQSHGYGMRDSSQSVQSSACSGWDKPLGSQLRADHEAGNMLGVSIEGGTIEGVTPSPGLGNEKVLGKTSQIPDKNLLDGATPPVNTIIFENTNFKSAPGVRSSSRNSVPGNDKPRTKMDENIDSNVFAKPINELLQKTTDANGKADAMQIQAVFKEETDMKLDFFGSDLAQLTEDKATKNLCMSKSITSVNSTICNADSLNMKIASVKKVWDTSEQETEDANGISFGAPLDSAFKGSDTQDEGHHEGFSPGGNQATSTTNVCKVKPTQQVSSATGQTVSSASQQPHSAIVGHPMLLGTPLSPPPMPAAAVGVSLGPQPFATNQHLAGFPTGAPTQGVAAAGSAAQYGMSAIPSPPTVLYNSAQQIQSGLYGAFLPTADQAGVLGGQGHARAGGFGQYPAAGAFHGLTQPTNSPYNTQSVYMPTPPHPPPTAQAPPELYPSMGSFRLSTAGPFGQNQPLNNPTTVLISSTSNSLMSASVKPSSQSISAIGTKAGGVGQAYQQQSQQGQPVYMAYDSALQAVTANYLSSAGVMQRGPAVQNSGVPGLQHSSSYYSGSSGGQTGYYQQPGNSVSAQQIPQHQAGYGLQGNVFGTHNQSNTGLQGSFPYLSTQIQVAATLNPQQYRPAATASMQNPYLKGVGGVAQQISGDQQVQQQTSGGPRPQQLKSPSSQEVLSSVFNSAPQIPSPKSRQNNKHTPQQSSPTTQRKYGFYQGVGSQQNNIQQRYPTPIQRPVNFQQQNMISMQSNGPSNQKHSHNRNNSNKAPNRQYYGGQSSALQSNQPDKSDDSKVVENAATKTANSTDIVKDSIKEDAPVLKE